MKKRIIEFHKGRIPRVHTVMSYSPYFDDPNVIIDPDLSALVGTHQHFWKRDPNDDKKVILMDESEQKQVLMNLESLNELAPLVERIMYITPLWVKILLFLSLVFNVAVVLANR